MVSAVQPLSCGDPVPSAAADTNAMLLRDKRIKELEDMLYIRDAELEALQVLLYGSTRQEASVYSLLPDIAKLQIIANQTSGASFFQNMPLESVIDDFVIHVERFCTTDDNELTPAAQKLKHRLLTIIDKLQR